jgi:hypothetical protein
MAPTNFSKLEEKLSLVSIGHLGKGDFDFLVETLRERPEITVSFENPIMAMFHIYKEQKTKKTKNAKLEEFIMTASTHAMFGDPEGRRKNIRGALSEEQRVERRENTVLKLARAHGSVGQILGLDSLVRELRPVMSEALRKQANKMEKEIHRTEDFERRIHARVAKYSYELAEAQEREVRLLRIDAKEKLQMLMLEPDKEVWKESLAEAFVQITEAAKRTRDMQAERLSMLKNRHVPLEDKLVEIDFNFDLVGVARKLQGEAKKYRFYQVDSSLSPKNVEAEGILQRFFPRYEIDPHVDVNRFLDRTSTGVVEKGLFGTDVYNRAFLFYATDEKGKPVAAVQGTFTATSESNAFYVSQICVLEKHQRNNVVYLLGLALVTESEQFARDAEKKLGVKYPPGTINKNALMNAIGEMELLSRRPSEIVGTWKRLPMAGKIGYYTPKGAPHYLQVDTTFAPGEKYDAERFTPVPLLAISMGIGRETTGLSHVQSLICMMEGFKDIGNSDEGLRQILKFMLGDKVFGELSSTGRFSEATQRELAQLEMIRLPTSRKEVVKFGQMIGDKDQQYATHYKDFKVAKEGLASAEKSVSWDEAFAISSRGGSERF